MPKLSKIRLTGCKYDGLRKEHENSIFDLTKNDKADHSLFTLCNGGGKGVMMQLIFQLLLPETRWGKNNGNKVISMFYDQRNNLHPFTFHVALEWILDTVPEKRLITGIAVKSIIRNASSEEEDKTGLSFFLYTHEHENNGYFTIENLPLYDKNAKEAVDIDVLDNFINSNRRYFIKYSQSSVRRKDSDYFRYLESRGIYRSEWINLKDINKLEGGSGDYFVGASDNKSIFDKIIIPAISENIKNYTYDDGDNLIEMFRSNLSITKDLPVLIKREGDYKELLVEIKPLIENADIGSRLIDIKERLIDEGNDIFFGLNDEDSVVNKEIEKWENELKKSEIERDELLYKKDNLNYNQQKKNIEIREKEVKSLEIQFEKKSIEIKDKKEERLLYEINKVLYHKKSVENDISSKSKAKEELIELLDIDDIKEKAEDLDYEIELEWDKTKKAWINIENQFTAYINYTNQMKEQNDNQKKKYRDRIDGLQKEVNKFEIKEDTFNKGKRKLEEIYDPLSLLFPDRIFDDLAKVQDETKEKINLLNDEIASYKERVSALDSELIKFNLVLDNQNKAIKLLNNDIQNQEKYELELSREIAKQLLENQVGGLLTHNWFNKKMDKLEYMKNDKKAKLESIQRAIWEKSIEKSLNKEDYFIPNKDILQIKEEINRLDINVQTGSEYLKKIDEEDRLSFLDTNPGFLYSLVIGNQKDWQLIERNISKNIFINNMVPIYIRSEMNSHSSVQFKIVHGKADALVNEDAYLVWKSEMEQDIENLTQTEKSLKEDIDNIEQILKKIGIINTKDTVLMLNQKLKYEEAQVEELLDQIRINEEEKLSINNKTDVAEGTLRENKDKLGEINSSIKQIIEYIEKSQEIEYEKSLIINVEKEIKELKRNIQNLDEANDEISYNQNSIRDSYGNWKISINAIINDMKEVYKEAIFDYRVDNSYVNHKIPDFVIAADRLSSLIKERKIIEENIATKNTTIALLDNDLKHLSNGLSRHIKELEELSKSWTDYEYLELPLDEVIIKINELTKNIENIEKEKTQIKSSLDGANGSIKIMRNQLADKETNILKAHKKAPVILVIGDIKSEINIVERDIKSNQTYLTACDEVLQKNRTKRMKLEINLSKIKTGYTLELTKGKMNKLLKEKLEETPDLIVEEWLRKCENNKIQVKKTMDEGERLITRFIKEIDSKLEENKLKEKITSTVKEAKISNFKNNLISFKSMENHFQNELLRLTKDKSKAEEAMKQWTNRASIHVIRMIEALKNMVSSMNYTNEQGYAFPLVKLKGVERLPKEESEITHLLDEYFIQSISKILEKDLDISNIEDKELKGLMGDKVIFSKALQGRYPTLLVYKMSEKNEFRYARARDEYYTTWEAINKGEGDLPEGSGGQTLSINTFVIMMIMSFKKKHIGNENPSTVLILDNPFGKASAKHVLDPIFEIANKLNFQLICFAAPEIIKVEISERFPVFWELKIEDGKVVHGGRIILTGF